MADSKTTGKRRDSKWSDLMSSVKAMAVATVTSIIFMLAMRNTLTHYVDSVWGASGNFWQLQWDVLLEYCHHDQWTVLVMGMYVLPYFVYWVGSFAFSVMDFTNKPAFMRAYKVQPGTNEPLDVGKFMKLVAVVHFNQIVTGALAVWFVYAIMTARGYDANPTLPSFQLFLVQLAFFVVMEEIGFYYSHRILHHRLLYKHIHKLHHEWQAPIAATVIYCHPVEFLFSNLMPGILGPLITGCHFSTLIIWTQIQIIFSLHQHSGYHIPFMPSPEAHDYHHLKFNQCFGVLGVLDLLHGTDDKFRASKCYSRDFISLSLTPVRQQVPDK